MGENENSRSSRSFFRDRWVRVAVVCAILALAGMITTAVLSLRKHEKVAPGFVLRDQRGRLTSLAQFRGKVVVLTFIDPYCREICPLTTESMVQALRLLGPAASQVQLLGVDANPLATRISDVAAYTRAHQLQGRWRFLTGSLAQLKRVWASYHVYVAAIQGHIDHEAVVFVIGPHGHERAVYSTQMNYEGVPDQARLLATSIARLLPGHPTLGGPPRAELPPLTPTAKVRLTAFGTPGRTVDLGAAHAHLLLFFAGWLREKANLPAKLAALDRYARAARRHGWPTPVAINEVPTETSAKASRHLLAQLAAALHTPIVDDAQGRLAAGYGVQGLPWFVLSSRTGRILWHHSGWLSAAALGCQVQAALATGERASAS
jgi:cytochrome oxidase Cu insertion factor (SCO1/SenC/PrrC family)